MTADEPNFDTAPVDHKLFERAVKGEELLGVVFFAACVSLVFEESGLTIFNDVTVNLGGTDTRRGDRGWRNDLCRLVGTQVAEAPWAELRQSLRFENGATIAFCIEAERADFPEAAVFAFRDQSKPMMVFRAEN